MSDPMRPPMAPAGAPQGGPPRMGMQGQGSVLNPNDMARKVSSGQISMDMTIRDFYAQMGLDVDQNTLGDLAQTMKGQAQTATPVGKMRATAGGVAAGPPAAPPPGGMAGLMSRAGGSPPTNGSRY